MAPGKVGVSDRAADGVFCPAVVGLQRSGHSLDCRFRARQREEKNLPMLAVKANGIAADREPRGMEAAPAACAGDLHLEETYIRNRSLIHVFFSHK
jgi:hypothetical protein